MPFKIKATCGVTILAGLALLPIEASAVTLHEALIQAYRTNPTLESSRASLRAQDESVVQAGAGMRPTVTASGSATVSQALDSVVPPADTLRASLDARLTIFDGGRTAEAVNAAANMVFAARENLKASSQSTLLNAATAYLDVRRDQKFLALSQNEVNVNQQQLKAMEDRFAVGAVTRTEVALVQARLAATKTSLPFGAFARNLSCCCRCGADEFAAYACVTKVAELIGRSRVYRDARTPFYPRRTLQRKGSGT